MPVAQLDRTQGVPAYRPGSNARCPSCGESNWLVGRNVAECGYCAAALPIVVPMFRVTELRRAA